ncbi:glycosyltransferase family 4 protein [Lutibacter flavus]|uniref:Glycosyltransferase involved in cell wall bisynthesis n=1 Tax=Lutibacter flavus TaxID=691689 RepID=A0A238VQN6_9FLAO|nr:glycosyltransferase family 4 protein [Lutibacter flavus]SNR36457.1 Glycosyltransferase involved in cell wall bisynthesis [Lutibacter flavus]
MKRIVYIGNNLTKKTAYNSTMATLTELLLQQGFSVTVSSDKSNKILRLFDMVICVLKNRNKVDVLLIDTFSTLNFYYAFVISQFARLLNIKYIPILHGGNLPFRIENSKFTSKLIFKNSYKNISPSIYLQKEFSARGYKTEYIPNSIPIKEYNFKERQHLSPKILWVRAFDKTYNPLLAVKVLNLVKKQFENAKLCMVGPTKDGTFEEVQLLVDKLNLTENIKFTGVLKKEDWHQLSNEYDIFINTTNIDNMPVSLLEAMALGLPIISTNVGGIPYLIKNKENGILVSANDEQEMANAIINILNNPDEANRLSLSARLFSEQFDIEKIKVQWYNLLK